MGFFSGMLDLLFPPKCIYCRRVKQRGDEPYCAACAASLPLRTGEAALRRGDYFDLCVSPLTYDGAVRAAILRYKFRGQTQYADRFGTVVAQCISEHLAGQYDLITWVPLSGERKKDRGYDQAMLLALAAALELGDVAAETLRKTRHVPAQSSLEGGAEARRTNIAGVYEASDPELIAGRRVLLIDDILTTGSTLSECARVLLMAGAERVVCATIAATDK